MAIIDQKRDIFSEISASRSLTEGFPELQLNDSFPSLNNQTDSINFLTNLLKSLVGFGEIRDKIVDILSKKTDIFEDKIKFALKKSLKSYVNCNIDPSVPSSFLNGYDFKVQNIDFTNMLKVDPTSNVGKLMYIDNNAGLNSDDLNTFLHATIQDEGNTNPWKGIIDVQFNQNGTPSNTLNVKANSNYSGKTLTEFNNDLLDNTELFNVEKLLTKIIDSVFGTVSFEVGFTKEQAKQEEKVKGVVEKISASEDDQTIDDSFFQFSDVEINEQLRRAENRANGLLEIVTCNNAESSVSFNTVNEMHDNLSSATTKVEQTKEIENKLNQFGQESASNVSSNDQFTVEINFLTEIITKLHVAIINLLLSPKVILLFALNYKILNGPNATFSSVEDFMSKNKAMIEQVIKDVRDEIVQELLSQALKEINQLIESKIQGIISEKLNNQKAQLASLFGVPQEVIRTISDLS